MKDSSGIDDSNQLSFLWSTATHSSWTMYVQLLRNLQLTEKFQPSECEVNRVAWFPSVEWSNHTLGKSSNQQSTRLTELLHCMEWLRKWQRTRLDTVSSEWSSRRIQAYTHKHRKELSTALQVCSNIQYCSNIIPPVAVERVRNDVKCVSCKL